MNDENTYYCGWDIGGAHLKLAGLSEGLELQWIEQIACPLWLGVEHLEKAIKALIVRRRLTEANHGFTMTGELCDSFGDRVKGVGEIVDCLAALFDPHKSHIFGLNNQWYEFKNISGRELDIASANWYATASYCAQKINQGVIIDIGSTTTDLVPIIDGKVAAVGEDDFSRLKNFELVYTGVVRTPVAAMVDTLPYRNESIPIVAEYFANAADIYRILQSLPPEADMYDTADGNDKSINSSATRLFRMICRDYAEELAEAKVMAAAASEAQLERLMIALAHQLERHDMSAKNTTVVGLGCGAMLADNLAQRCGLDFMLFSELLASVAASEPAELAPDVCGPAVAVAFGLAGR